MDSCRLNTVLFFLAFVTAVNGQLSGLMGLPGMMPGLQGMSGLQGLSDMQSLSGLQGLSGIQGLSDLQGMSGLQGLPGIPNLQGMSGLEGLLGMHGGAMDMTTMYALGRAEITPADLMALRHMVHYVLGPRASPSPAMFTLVELHGGAPETFAELLHYLPMLQEMAIEMGIKPPGVTGNPTPLDINNYIYHKFIQYMSAKRINSAVGISNINQLALTNFLTQQQTTPSTTPAPKISEKVVIRYVPVPHELYRTLNRLPQNASLGLDSLQKAGLIPGGPQVGAASLPSAPVKPATKAPQTPVLGVTPKPAARQPPVAGIVLSGAASRLGLVPQNGSPVAQNLLQRLAKILPPPPMVQKAAPTQATTPNPPTQAPANNNTPMIDPQLLQMLLQNNAGSSMGGSAGGDIFGTGMHGGNNQEMLGMMSLGGGMDGFF